MTVDMPLIKETKPIHQRIKKIKNFTATITTTAAAA